MKNKIFSVLGHIMNELNISTGKNACLKEYIKKVLLVIVYPYADAEIRK